MKAVFDPYLTQHAIDRYRQRVENIPAQEVPGRVLTGKARALLALGCERIDCGAFWLRARRGAVLTVLLPESNPTKAKIRERKRSRKKGARCVLRSSRF